MDSSPRGRPPGVTPAAAVATATAPPPSSFTRDAGRRSAQRGVPPSTADDGSRPRGGPTAVATAAADAGVDWRRSRRFVTVAAAVAAVAAAVVTTTSAVAAAAAAAASDTATSTTTTTTTGTTVAAIDAAAKVTTPVIVDTDDAAAADGSTSVSLSTALRATGGDRRPLFRWNAGGGATGFFAGDADSGTAGITYEAPPRRIKGGRGWTPVYLSHRLAPGGRLALAFPVPAGTYDVTLMWAEVWFSAAGERVLRVAVGELRGEVAQGQIAHLDVAAEAGANASLVRTFRDIRVRRGGKRGGGLARYH